MNVTQLLAIFWSRRHIILAIFVSAVIAALGVSATLTPQYTATAQLFVNLAEPNSANNTPIPAAVVRNYITTQIEALRSRGTAVAVVQRERLAESGTWQKIYTEATGGRTEMVDWIAGVIQRGAQIQRQGSSDIIGVTYSSSSPETAARMANAFADAYVRLEVERRTEPARDLVRWQDERLNQMRERMQALETERSRLRLEALRSGDPDAAGVVDPAAALPAVLANARNGLLQARVALQQAQAGQIPPADNPELLQLRRQVSDIDLAIRREQPLLGPTHRRIQNLKINQEQLNTQITALLERLRNDVVAERQREVVAAEQRVQEANALIARDESQRLTQVGTRSAAASLDRDIESLKAQIDSMTQRRERSTVEGAAMMSNISVLSRAAVPVSPSAPNVTLIMAVVSALGLAFGFALAFLREMIDRRVRCPADLTGYFDTPMLGQVTGKKLSTSMKRLPPIPERAFAGTKRDAPRVIEVSTAARV